MNSPHVTSSNPSLLKRTVSRCPVCHEAAPGEVVESAGKVYLERTCPSHGAHSVRISSDKRFYHLSKGSGCSGPECCDEQSSAAAEARDRFDTLSTCIALIEIVNSCNIACPTCFSDSPNGREVDCIPFDDFRSRVEGVITRKGGIEILQLSGGEPTLHPEFFELLGWAQAHPKIDYVLVNTNGVRLAKDATFAEQLNANYKRGGLQLYLQFDGTEAAGQQELRGADLRAIRREALERAGSMDGGGLPVTLAMTVIPENLDQLWSTVAFGLEFPHVRGVAFQPMFRSGRSAEADAQPLNAADIILGLVDQSGGTLNPDAFTPLPCGDPNCATIGYLLKHPDGVKSMSDFVDYSQVQGFLSNRLNYNLDDLAQCGCEAEPLGAMLKELEIDEAHTFRLFIKPFMDAHSWDEDRIDRCCTHVIRPDGKLDSFCRYYSGFPGTWNAPATQCASKDCSCA